MIEISDIKWYILAIVAIFVVIGLLMLLWAIRLLQAQNTYRKLLNVSIDNEKRTNLGIQSEKELNKFLFELLKDLVSPGDEQTALYKRCLEILSETAANVYLQDLADFVAINPNLEGFEFYPLYVIDMSKLSYK